MPTIWRGTHKTFLASKGLNLHMLRLPTSKWLSVVSQRGKQCLGFTMRWWPAATAVDLGQRIDRLSVGFDNQLPTICPSSRFWLLPDNKNKRRKYEHRFLLGREALHIQGFPVDREP